MASDVVGLRELRQRASELVRRAEAGEVVTVTVNGRVAARLVPPGRSRWRAHSDVEKLFDGPVDEAWPEELDRFDDTLHDPWNPQ